jgi:hypothetical protein
MTKKPPSWSSRKMSLVFNCAPYVRRDDTTSLPGPVTRRGEKPTIGDIVVIMYATATWA